MDLRLQPKPEVEVTQADKGIISRAQYFVEKKFEKINQYCFPAHLIRNWKPKAQLLYPSGPDEIQVQYECDFNRDVQNCFVEDYAEEVFLRTPPPCFVVIGKCGWRVNKLGREIAEEYGSVFIQVDDIVSQVIRTETETSVLLRRILRLGVSLTLNFILPLLSLVAHTPEARHRGYVLCGLPRIPTGYDLSAEQQFNYLFTWDNKPTVFIHVLFEDEDLFRERISQRYEVRDAYEGKSILFHPQLDDSSEDEPEVEDPDEKDLLPIKNERVSSDVDVDISPSRPWVTLPKDEECQVWSELELFDLLLKPVIELITSRMDPQYFITVDSRVQNEFEMVRARLSLLQVWKSPVAFPFIRKRPKKQSSDEDAVTEDEEEEEEEEEGDENVESEEYAEILRVAEEPPQVAFRTLFTKKTISPKFRWELSHYNYICPVSLRESLVVEGKSAYAVAFMKYIYFLRDEECMRKFLQNPRAYVLPIRPKPLCRFIIIGFPFTGKTTLANDLAREFSIPLLDLNAILQADINRKKSIYRQFCKEKAECREILRLTALAWQDWRAEEEQRVTLIENWIMYIQSLLSQRVAQFYTPEIPERETKTYSPPGSTSNVAMQGEDDAFSGESKRTEYKALEVRGVAVDLDGGDTYARERTPVDNNSTASVKIIHAMKHEDFDFNENRLEVDANLFFSTLWNTFSNRRQKHSENSSVDEGEEGEEGGEGDDVRFDRESLTIDWWKLLPAQSLSTFLMNRKQYTIREKRESFQVLLEAASKNYWSPNSLKSELAKWRLPCFMDIPLCEIFLDNPTLLLKYVPDWLRERPPIPDAIDHSHPSVMEAGNEAFEKAGVVKISQNYEEVAILLRDAIEKAEREGMRVTGEVISPGGWVLDNMTLDIDVWKKLACENIFADKIYILIDPDPEYRRILNTWCDLYCPSVESFESITREETDDTENAEEFKEDFEVKKRVKSESLASHEVNLFEAVKESTELIDLNEEELDDIFSAVQNAKDGESWSVEAQTDPFCHGILYGAYNNYKALKLETVNEEPTSNILIHSDSTALFVKQLPQTPYFFSKINLGTKLQVFTENILNLFDLSSGVDELKRDLSNVMKDELKFFIDLLTLPQKLDRITEFLTSIKRETIFTKIDITGKKEVDVFEEIKSQLLEPFIKRPRELEDFEVEEIKKWTERENATEEEEDDDDEEEVEKKTEKEEEEDIRIFGESGSLCIVSLERNILLPGKPEFALRYYGKLYYFWDEVEKNNFIDDPEKYAPYYSAIRCYPPLRVFVMGPVGSGKTNLCHAIAEQCSLNYVDYLTLLNKNLVPHLQEPCEKFTALHEQRLLLREEHNAAAKSAKEDFMKAPVSLRTQFLECPFYSNLDEYKGMIETLNSNSFVKLDDAPELSYQTIEPRTTPSEEYDLPPPPPFVSLKDMDVILNDYIRNVSDLGEYGVSKSLQKLWSRRPYVTEGFILEGFPMRAFDIQHMLKNRWIPDLLIEISVPEDTVVENNIERMMELWNRKLKQETVEEKILEDTLEVIQRSSKWSKRDVLLQEKMAKVLKALEENPNDGKESISDRSEDYGKRKTRKTASVHANTVPPQVESKIIAEIDEILEKEFPPLEFKAVFETYEAGKERLVDDLIKNYRRDVEEINAIKNLLQEANVKWFEVNNENEDETILKSAFVVLDELKKRKGKKGEFAFTMKMEMAEKLLEQGYYFLSKFGRWCPVQVYRLKNSIHMFRPLSARGKVVPVAYRNYIYFVAGESERKKFIEDPIKYTFNEPHHPNIPLRVAVIGPPKSGKSTLSIRLGAMFGLKVVTMGTALRFVVESIPRSTLAKNVNNYLRRGCFLPLSLKIEAVLACLHDAACVTQGFVLDGIPFDAALTQSLAERGKLPFVIISLTTDVDFGKTNRQNLNLAPFRLPYKNRVNLDMRYKEWDESYKKFAQWNQSTYNNLYEVNARSNIVDIFYQAYDIIRKAQFGILHYVEYCVTDKVLPLQYLCVSQHEYELRKSPLESNCPVCWASFKRLTPNSDPPKRSGLVQYLENFYWVCPEHMEKFMKSPKMYFPPHADDFPELLPRAITHKMYESMSPQPEIHGYGRCPVTRIDFPSRLDWEGSWDCAALYGDKVFLCKNKEMLNRFLMRPWNYTSADTIFEVNRPCKSKAVEQLEPPVISSLPPIGFLEQTISGLIAESLRIVGYVRPVYPNMSTETTGCVFLALLLKSENPRNKYRYLVKQYLNFMVQNCKSSNYASTNFRKPEDQIGQGDFEPTFSDSLASDGSDTPASVSQLSLDSFCWMDVDSQADKQMWSAQREPLKTKMHLTIDDELEEIPTHPKIHVILKYQSYVLRHCPLPPIERCGTRIYTATPNMTLPEPFNYNSLYQPLPLFPSPYPTSVAFNPEKAFPGTLYNKTSPDPESTEHLRKGPRAYSANSSIELKRTEDPDYNFKLVAEHFMPRFQFLDKMPSLRPPPVPKVADEELLFYSPQRDQTYMMLYAEFFHMSHVLRCYEWSLVDRFLELDTRVYRHIRPELAEIEMMHPPKPSPSVEMKTSLDFYHDDFDACAKFVSPPQERVPEDDRRRSSLISFIQNVIVEKLYEIFATLSDTDLSYESFETVLVESRERVGKSAIFIREIFPYPPLNWDIICRPYFAYASINTIFSFPAMDDIAHERHFSLLDGIELSQEKIRFVRYPSWLQLRNGDNGPNVDHFKMVDRCEVAKHHKGYLARKDDPFCFVYDFFHIPWTSFLTYPFAWAYNEDVTTFFREKNQSEK